MATRKPLSPRMIAILKEAGAPHDEGISDGRLWLQWSDKVWRHEWSKGGSTQHREQSFRRVIAKRLAWERGDEFTPPPPPALNPPPAPETGREMAGATGVVTRQDTEHPGGQNLMRCPEGSNGGVHRGRDKFPRRNAIRAIFLHAMAQEQEREHIDPSTGEAELDANGQPVKRKMRMAMVQDIVMAYQLIARNAASGRDLDQFLRMMSDAHNMLQPEKDEAGQGRTPIPARFVLAQDVCPGAPARRRRRRATLGVWARRGATSSGPCPAGDPRRGDRDGTRQGVRVMADIEWVTGTD